MISEDGDVDISVAAITRRAGVAHGLLFYYFTDKQGLVAAALADVLGKLATEQSPRENEQSARDRVEGFVRRHIEFLQKYRILYTRVVLEGALGDPAVEVAIRHARVGGAHQVAQLAGLDTPLPPLTEAAVLGWTGFLDRAAEAWLDSDIPLDSVVTMIVDTFDGAVSAAASE